MVAALIDLLTGAQRIALPFLEAGVAEGLSANKILTTLQEAGFGINRNVGLKLISNIVKNQESASYVSNAPLTDLLDINQIGIANSVGNGKFAYTIKAFGRDVTTGRFTNRYVTVASEEPISPQQAIDLASGYFTGQNKYADFSFQSAQVTQALINPLFA